MSAVDSVNFAPRHAAREAADFSRGPEQFAGYGEEFVHRITRIWGCVASSVCVNT